MKVDTDSKAASEVIQEVKNANQKEPLDLNKSCFRDF
jgi:hypothetical protein